MIKLTHTINDADLEAGMAQALAAHNATLQTPLTTEEFVAAAFDATVEVYRGSAKRALAAKIAELPAAAVAEVAALVETKIPAKIAAATEEVKP